MPEAIKFGWTGVDLFFVLSGFLISSQLFSQIKKKGTFSLKEFFVKRFFRIVPIYLFVISIYFLFPFFHELESLPPLWKYLTFTHNFDVDLTNHRTFVVAWSLCVEEHFYLLLPITLLFFLATGTFRKSYILIIILFLLGFLTRLYYWYQVYIPQINEEQLNGISPKRIWVEIFYFATYIRLDGLLVGLCIAIMFQFFSDIFEKFKDYGNLIIGVGILLLTFVYFFCGDIGEFSTAIIGFQLLALGYGFVVLGAIMPSSFLYKWQSKTMNFVARLSYTLYLIHISLISVAHKTFSSWGVEKGSALMMILTIGLCLTAAFILHITIERPFLKMRERFIKPVTSRESIPA